LQKDSRPRLRERRGGEKTLSRREEDLGGGGNKQRTRLPHVFPKGEGQIPCMNPLRGPDKKKKEVIPNKWGVKRKLSSSTRFEEGGL